MSAVEEVDFGIFWIFDFLQLAIDWQKIILRINLGKSLKNIEFW
jgi:hypothetical protein